MVCSVLFTYCSSDSEPTFLVEQGVTQFQIVISEQAPLLVSEAAGELASNLRRMTNATFISLNDGAPEARYEILVGNTNRSSFSGDPGEYSIREEKGKLYLNGHSDEDVYRAVSQFLENIGCKKYARGYSIIPQLSDIHLPEGTTIYKQAFEHREILYPEASEQTFTNWHGLTSFYFDKQSVPNWGSKMAFMIDNSELSPANPCLTDGETAAALIDQLKKEMERRRFSPTWYLEPSTVLTQCVEEGSLYGDILIDFVNSVADSFPDKKILVRVTKDFMPVSGSVKPTAENIEWIISTEEVDRSRPIISNQRNSWFKDSLEKWKRLSDQIVILDYLGNTDHVIHPLPHLRTLQEDLQYYADLGITKIALVGSDVENGELAELRSYVGARLLSNPHVSIDTIVSDFTSSFYGAAGPPIKNYLEAMQMAVRRSDAPLYVDYNASEAINTFMAPNQMDEYNYFFNQAETFVSNDPELSNRVKKARLAFIYATLEQTKTFGAHSRGIYFYLNNGWRLISGMADLARNFTSEAKRLGIETYVPAGLTPDEYLADFENFLSLTVFDHIAVRHSTVTVSGPLDRKGNPRLEAFTDGIKGTTLSTFNWAGSSGRDLVIDVQLDTLYTVRSIEMDFLNNISVGIFLPSSIKIETSADSTNFQLAGTRKRTTSIQTEEPHFETFQVGFSPRRISRIRITATNEGTYPSWHINAGREAKVMTDEIIVR